MIPPTKFLTIIGEKHAFPSLHVKEDMYLGERNERLNRPSNTNLMSRCQERTYPLGNVFCSVSQPLW